MANTYLHRTPSSTTNRRTWTWSAWIKRSSLTNASNGHTLWETEGANGGDNFIFQIKGSNDTVHLHTYGNDVFTTTRKLRDTNGWYHIVLAIDTTQATATNRIKLYINGELQTITQATNYPAKDFEFGINKNHKHCIGSHGNNANYYFDGLMSHIHFADGTQYDASVFGETDATTGEWKIKTAPSFTLGTNGFTVLKDGNTVTDQSDNSNDFAISGTLTKTEDCPDNVLNTFSPLYRGTGSGSYSLSNGNTTFLNNASSPWANAFTSIGNSTGKFYTEFLHYTGTHSIFGIINSETIRQDKGTNDAIGSTAIGQPAASYYGNSGQSMINGTQASFGSAIASGDYVGMAVDLTNSKIYFSKNGVWQGSGDPSTGSNGLTITGDTTYVVGVGGYGSGGIKANFGNGSFGTTQLTGTTYSPTVGDTSAIFKYAVPTGYTALSTNGLNL